MESGFYTLQLICDGRHPAGANPIEEVLGKTRMEAKEKARSYGWMLTLKRQSFCSECAEERRNTRERR